MGFQIRIHEIKYIPTTVPIRYYVICILLEINVIESKCIILILQINVHCLYLKTNKCLQGFKYCSNKLKKKASKVNCN